MEFISILLPLHIFWPFYSTISISSLSLFSLPFLLSAESFSSALQVLSSKGEEEENFLTSFNKPRLEA